MVDTKSLENSGYERRIINDASEDEILNQLKNYPVILPDWTAEEIKRIFLKKRYLEIAKVIFLICFMLMALYYSVTGSLLSYLFLTISFCLMVNLVLSNKDVEIQQLATPIDISRIGQNKKVKELTMARVYSDEIHQEQYRNLYFVCEHYPEIKNKCKEIMDQRNLICKMDYTQLLINGFCLKIIENDSELNREEFKEKINR